MVGNPAGMPSTAGIPKELTETTKARAPPPATAGPTRGRVTLRSVVIFPAPEARAAHSSSGRARVANDASATRYTRGAAWTAMTSTIPAGPMRPGSVHPKRSSVRPPGPKARVHANADTNGGTSSASSMPIRRRRAVPPRAVSNAPATPMTSAPAVAAVEVHSEFTIADAPPPDISNPPLATASTVVRSRSTIGITTSTRTAITTGVVARPGRIRESASEDRAVRIEQLVLTVDGERPRDGHLGASDVPGDVGSHRLPPGGGDRRLGFDAEDVRHEVHGVGGIAGDGDRAVERDRPRLRPHQFDR